MTSDPDQLIAEEFYDAVLRYLEVRREVDEANMLYNWIKQGNPVYGFICRQDVVRNMSDTLIENHIPFLCVTEPQGDIGFLIRSCDDDAVVPLKRAVLDKRANYCKTVSSEELKKELVKAKEQDKNLLFISNLKEEQVEILKDLCSEYLDDPEIGVDEMKDGTFTFSFPGARIFHKRKKDVATLNMLFALLMLETLGLNEGVNNRNARNARNFNKALARGFAGRNINLKRTPAWIIGSGKNYIRLDGYGFEYGNAIVNPDGRVDLEEAYSMDASTPDYAAQLNSYILRIPDRTVTYDMNQAMRHLSGRDADLDYAETSDQRIIRLFERQIVFKADDYVMMKIQTDPVMTMEGRWDEKLKHYLGEMAKLIDGARMENTIPEGYTKRQVDEIREIGESHGIKLEAYAPAISGMRHLETTLIKARLPVIHDIGEKIEKAEERSKGHTRDRERGGSMGRSL